MGDRQDFLGSEYCVEGCVGWKKQKIRVAGGQGPGEDRVGRQRLNCAASLRPTKEFGLYCRPPQGKLSRFLLHGITRVVRYKDPGGYDGERAGVGSWIMDT